MLKVHVLAVGDRLAMNDAAAIGGARRYYGRSISAEWPPPAKQGGDHVPASPAVRRMIQQGDLAPGDATTAAWAGVPFTPPRSSSDPKRKSKRASTARTKE